LIFILPRRMWIEPYLHSSKLDLALSGREIGHRQSIAPAPTPLDQLWAQNHGRILDPAGRAEIEVLFAAIDAVNMSLVNCLHCGLSLILPRPCRFGRTRVHYSLCPLLTGISCLQRIAAVDDGLGSDHSTEGERRHNHQSQNDQDCEQEIELHFLPPCPGDSPDVLPDCPELLMPLKHPAVPERSRRENRFWYGKRTLAKLNL
jgi:hypothetical protein